MTTPFTVLILGGYGTFGGKLARILARWDNTRLVIAGRSEEKAKRFAGSLQIAQRATGLKLDRDSDRDIQAVIAAYRADLTVDASGPFQSYGPRPYRVAEACLAAGCHYIDLADGADFVDGITQLDAEARQRGLSVLSGVSSFPVLTAAVARVAQEGGLDPITAIEAGIAPSPYANVGLNVIRAVAGYAGKPIHLRDRNGAEQTAYALVDARTYAISVRGVPDLGARRFTLFDTPDMTVLPKLFPQATVWVGAAPVPGLLHHLFSLLARGVRRGLLPNLAPVAPLIHWAANTIRWGAHRGGMFVQVTGIKADGTQASLRWTMIAEGDDGPYIPSMAAAALVRHWMSGEPPAAGARPCLDDVTLADYAPLFAERAIRTDLVCV